MSEHSIAKVLAQHIRSCTYEGLPADVLQQVKRLVFDWIGVCHAGRDTEVATSARNFALHLGGEPTSTMFGNHVRVPASHAAMANAVAACCLELDDVDPHSLYHFGPPVVSAAIAVAEQLPTRGRDLLTAIALGCDVMARLSNVMNPELRNRGFQTTGVCGALGAAAAAAKLFDLDEETIVSAFALASAQASGLLEVYSAPMQKAITPGFAARNGVVAVQLAAAGVSGAETIFEGERGLLRAFAGAAKEASSMVKELGRSFPAEIEFKLYPFIRALHAAIDCALTIRTQPGFDSGKISRVLISRHTMWSGFHDNRKPGSAHEARLSQQGAIGFALVHGVAWDRLDKHFYTDRLPRTIMQVTELATDNSIAEPLGARVSVECIDGRKFEASVRGPIGSKENPIDDEALVRKCVEINEPEVGYPSARALFEAIQHLDAVDLVDIPKLLKIQDRNQDC